MVEAVVLAWSKPFRHRLDALAVTGTVQLRRIKRVHLPSLLVPKLLQKGLQNAERSESNQSWPSLKEGEPESSQTLLARIRQSSASTPARLSMTNPEEFRRHPSEGDGTSRPLRHDIHPRI